MSQMARSYTVAGFPIVCSTLSPWKPSGHSVARYHSASGCIGEGISPSIAFTKFIPHQNARCSIPVISFVHNSEQLNCCKATHLPRFAFAAKSGCHSHPHFASHESRQIATSHVSLRSSASLDTRLGLRASLSSLASISGEGVAELWCPPLHRWNGQEAGSGLFIEAGGGPRPKTKRRPTKTTKRRVLRRNKERTSQEPSSGHPYDRYDPERQLGQPAQLSELAKGCLGHIRRWGPHEGLAGVCEPFVGELGWDEWHGVIKELGLKDEWELALGVLRFLDSTSEMSAPDRLRNSVIMTLGRNGRLDEAAELFMEVARSGRNISPFMYQCILCAFARGNHVKDVLRLLDRMEEDAMKPGVLLYNSILESMVAGKAPLRDVLEVFDRMLRNGIPPKRVTYIILMRACAVEGSLEDALQTYRGLKAARFSTDLKSYNALLHVAVMTERWPEAAKIVQRMWGIKRIRLNGSSCRLILMLCDRSGMTLCDVLGAGFAEDALVLYDYMWRYGLALPVHLHNELIAVVGRVNAYENAAMLYHDMRERGVQPDEATYDALVNKDWTGAVQHPIPLLVSIASAYRRSVGRTNVGLPDLACHKCLMAAYRRAGAMPEVAALFERMLRKKAPVDEEVCEVAVAAYDAQGRGEDARALRGNIPRILREQEEDVLERVAAREERAKVREAERAAAAAEKQKRWEERQRVRAVARAKAAGFGEGYGVAKELWQEEEDDDEVEAAGLRDDDDDDEGWIDGVIGAGASPVVVKGGTQRGANTRPDGISTGMGANRIGSSTGGGPREGGAIAYEAQVGIERARAGVSDGAERSVETAGLTTGLSDGAAAREGRVGVDLIGSSRGREGSGGEFRTVGRKVELVGNSPGHHSTGVGLETR